MSGRRFYFNIKHRLCQVLNPALCLMCGIPLAPNAYLCRDCLSSLTRVSQPCKLCGLPNLATGDTCPACLLHPPRWQRMIAPLVFSGATRELILQFKFHQQLHHARALVTHLLADYRQTSVDALIATPLHPLKRRERGYNQAQEIARILSEYLAIPLDSHSLKRRRWTGSQAGLSLKHRRNNLRGAFEFQAPQAYRSIAIIDDIITSGSTMNEICKVISKAGIRHIEVWSLARTLKH